MGITAGAMFVGSLIMQEKAQDKAERAQERARNEQEKSRAVQGAENASKARAEKVRQLREARILRGQMLGQSEATGVTGSSGSISALESLAAKSGDAIAMNIGAIEAANQMSIFEQNAVNFQGEAQNHVNDANMWGQVGSTALNIGMMSARTPSAPTGSIPNSIGNSDLSIPNNFKNLGR